MRVGSDRTVVAAFVGGGVLAGGNAVGIRWIVDDLAPLWAAALRFLLAATLLAVWVVARGLPWPAGRALLGTALFGVLNFAGAFGFAYYALQHMQAGLASTLLALVPLVTLLLAVAHRQERLRPAAVGGGVLALLGVGVVSGAALEGDVPVLAVLAGLGSVACFGEAAVVVRGFPRVRPVVANTVAMAVGGVLLLVLAILVREPRGLPSTTGSWLALGYLVVLGSIVVFLLYLHVLDRWPASRAVYFDTLIPPSAVLLSAWLDDEPLTLGLVVGGALILAGVWVGALSPGGSAPASDVAAALPDGDVPAGQ